MLLNIFIFIFGLIIGSFLNVVIYRLPQGLSIIKPGSHCFNCKTHLKPLDLIPVVSYVINNGKCRYCDKSIDFQYPLVEILTGIIFIVIFMIYGISYEALKWFLFASILIAVSLIDLKHYKIPNKIIVAGLVFLVIFTLLFETNKFIDSVIGLMVTGGVLFLITIIYPRGMGGGDVKLAALMGGYLGWQMGLLSLFFASFLGSIVSVILIFLGILNRKSAVPFGPFLALGAFVSLLYGEAFIHWYFKFF